MLLYSITVRLSILENYHHPEFDSFNSSLYQLKIFLKSKYSYRQSERCFFILVIFRIVYSLFSYYLTQIRLLVASNELLRYEIFPLIYNTILLCNMGTSRVLKIK